MRYFEDIKAGDRFPLGTIRVSKEDIIRFAEQFDPQPFHIDEEAAAKSHFGGLIASGWHTTALYMRLFVDTMSDEIAGRGSPGVEDLRWKRPVRAGDALTGEFEVLETRPFRGGMGLVRGSNRMQNQLQQDVLVFVGKMLIACKENAE